MTMPIVTSVKKRLILSYEMKSIKNLSTAVKQVFGILRIIVRRNDFLEVKKSTVIRVDKPQEKGQNFRMHFIIPINIRDISVVEALLQEETTDLLDQQKDGALQTA
ncbi:MAG: hypothetical protein GF310_01535 [candidate division Zixibacteria bacterium]|nr:hypothetical protein [candidate division Zixibacteria bacterium]